MLFPVKKIEVSLNNGGGIQKKKWTGILAGAAAACLLLSGCGSDAGSEPQSILEKMPTEQNDADPAESGQEDGAAAGQGKSGAAGQGQSGGSGSGQDSGSGLEQPEALAEAEKGSGAGIKTAVEYGGGNRIEDQSFLVTLRPLGEVTFASYEPDLSENPLADVVFLIEKDGKVVEKLPGIAENNVNLEMFNEVEAVAFLDYNGDSCDDIILIISYDLGAGPQAGQPHSTVRYYKGSGDGTFSYERQMSSDATEALSEVTVQSAKDFIGAGSEEARAASLKPWQQAFIDYLRTDSDAENQKGYTLIAMEKDGIPQLVEVGDCEASGCRIVHYAGGKVQVTQLNRLNFTYIPGENLLCNSDGLMDSYYDLVYSIIDGKMTLIAQGCYGAKDNSRVEYDSNGEPIYQYYWNGEEMTAEEYGKAFCQVYDSTRAVGYGYGNLDSVEGMIGRIEQYYAGS